jgi:TonB-linked SusC/RagA family outer membrane protein
MFKRENAILLLSFLLISVSSFAQQITLQGRVTDSNSGVPIEGASLVVRGTSQTTQTNQKGEFTISLENNINSFLQVTFVGYQPQSIPVGDSRFLEIRLESQEEGLEEVVVTGYQTERKKDLTGAVHIADVDEMKKQTVANPMKALQGQVPGMLVTGNGAPSSPVTIRIRGIGTLNNNDPLYIIDGVPTKAGMHELNQADIESIQVLKDASSASIYGSRAANGVIIITTKRAKAGGVQVSANAFGALSSYINRVKLLDTEGYGKIQWQAYVNSGLDPNTNTTGYVYDWMTDPNTTQPVLQQMYVPNYLDAQKTMKSANTDWFDEIAQLGVVQNYDVQLANGTENGNYLLSLGYYDNKGVIKTNGFDRISARLNSDYKLLDGKITIGQNMSLTKTKEVSNTPIYESFVGLSIIPVHTIDGIGWGGPVAGMNDRQNPVRLLEDNKHNGYEFSRIFGNFYADVQLLPNLTFRSNFGIDYGNYTSRRWDKRYQSGYLESDISKVINNQSHSVKTTWSNTLSYNLVKENHRLDLLAGTEYNVDDFSSFMASREGYILEDKDYMYLDAGTGIKDNAGNGARSVLMSYFAKGNYSYMDRYLASVTIRRDGSSRFGENNRFGTFPAFSLGWRISEENFIKNKISALDDLKVRFGWGKTGNQEINNHAVYNIYLSSYNITAYDINGNKSGVLPSGYFLSQNANPDLRWEETVMSNLGLDFSFFGQKLYGSVDAYLKNTNDILLLPPYLGALGEGGNTWVNGASMENKGLEFVVGYKGRINDDLKFDITGNMDFVRNKVTNLPDEVVNEYGGDGRGQNILGRAFGSHFGYVADGVFRTQEELDNGIQQNGKGLGRIRYKDLNGDKVIDDYDRTWIGVPIPRVNYGLNVALEYKQFDLSFFLQGIGKIDVYNDFKKFTHFWSVAESSSNKGAALLDAWTPENINSEIPAVSLTDDNWEARSSTYYIENGAYLKLRNAQIGYTFNSNMLNRIHLRSLRLYLGGDNLGILYKSKSFTGLDPETSNFGYPNPMVWTAGLNIKF